MIESSIYSLAVHPRTFVVLEVMTKDDHVGRLNVRILAVQSATGSANEISANSRLVAVELSELRLLVSAGCT